MNKMRKRLSPATAMILALTILVPLLAVAMPGSTPGELIDLLSSEDSTKQKRMGFWAESKLDSMTLDEKIGQLFMVAAYSNKDEKHYREIESLVRKEKVGGLIFMQGGPVRQVNLVNRYQNAAEIPLMMAQDAEWGISMRLDSTIRFPRNMTLGAIRDSMPLFELGLEIGRQCRLVGVQVNFAPVVDVNNNPRNPVINDRSFGENPRNVAMKGLYFYKGMEYANCIGTVKHFPGHGDTDTDSHLALPVIEHDRQRLDSIELYPFKFLFENGVAGVMVAHLYIPSIDSTKNLASTLSPKVVTDLLKEEMGFKGLIFTDALGMKGVTKYWEDGETDLKAFLAGNDVLLFSKQVPKAKALIRKAIEDGEVTEKELNKRVLKILLAKEWTGLHLNKNTAKPKQSELNTGDAVALNKRLYQLAMTCVKNNDNLLPLKKLDERKIAVVDIAGMPSSHFSIALDKYAAVETFSLAKTATSGQRATLLKQLKKYNTVIVGVDGMSKRASKNFGVTASTPLFLEALKAQGPEVITVLFGSPYGLKHFGSHSDALLVAYENKKWPQIAAAEAIFGAIPVDGVLPITASKQFPEGTSIAYEGLRRFQFSVPEDAGMDGSILKGIDNIAQEAVKTGATPGCAVLVMRHNKIVFEKGYGKTEYTGGNGIDPLNTIYDLASVTKIAATTVATMKLVSEGLIDLDEHVSAYLQDFRGQNLTHIKVRNLLQHDAGFRSWIPFYRETIDSTGALDSDLYSTDSSGFYCVKVVDDLWICQNYQDSIWAKIVNSKVRTDHRVKYSDLSMMVMQKVIETVTRQPLEEYVDEIFYKPMGMNRTAFQPHKRLTGGVFPPTENDTYWRNHKVQGHVHDQASAMLGEVSGHAGLFSNIYDLAKMLLMVQNGGQYGELTYFPEQYVKQFTKQQRTDSRKGLGWDKAEMRQGKSNPCSDYASQYTFGHTGFTGIGAWVDPQYDLVYIFLSNRTFPTAENKKLLRQNIRPRIQDVIYESIFAYEHRSKTDS